MLWNTIRQVPNPGEWMANLCNWNVTHRVTRIWADELKRHSSGSQALVNGNIQQGSVVYTTLVNEWKPLTTWWVVDNLLVRTKWFPFTVAPTARARIHSPRSVNGFNCTSRWMVLQFFRLPVILSLGLWSPGRSPIFCCYFAPRLKRTETFIYTFQDAGK